MRVWRNEPLVAKQERHAFLVRKRACELRVQTALARNFAIRVKMIKKQINMRVWRNWQTRKI